MNKVSKVIIMILAVIGALGVFGVIYEAVTRDDTVGNYSREEWQPADRLTAVERKAYMDSCTSESGEASYCRCTLDYLEDNYTPNQIRDMGNETTPDSLPQGLWDAVEHCYHLVNVNEL